MSKRMDLDLANPKVIKQSSILHEGNRSIFKGLWIVVRLNLDRQSPLNFVVLLIRIT